jgi:hypothetical protein
MKKFFPHITILFLLVAVPFPANADISVSLRLDRSEITLADSVRVIVAISGVRDVDSRPVLRVLESFVLTQGGTSSRVQIINGKVDAAIDYTYFIQPKKVGTFQIGPAEVKIEDKTYKSNTETLVVVKPARASGSDRGPLFLSATLSDEEVYVEEQAIYTLKLYRKVTVKDIGLELPDPEHLTFKQLDKPVEYRGVYNGQPYQVLEVSYAVVSSKAGTFPIGPARMKMTVLEPGNRSPRSLFDDSFFSFSSGRPITLSSERLELNVLSLPEKGRPADFSGLVGKFEVDSTLEPKTVKAGESATLTVLVKGRGNVNRIPDLEFPKLDRVKVYADKPVLEVDQDARGLLGSKIMKWALVPEEEGSFEIPPLTVSSFDPKAGRYRVMRSPPYSFSALPGKEKSVQVFKDSLDKDETLGSAKKEIEELGRDILPIHTAMKDFVGSSQVRNDRWVLWAVLLTPLFAYMITFLAIKSRRQSPDAQAATKAKKAAKGLMAQCRKETLSCHDLISAIRDYLNNRFGLSIGTLTPNEAEEILTERGVTAETSKKLKTLIQGLEDAIYTGEGHESIQIGSALSEIIKSIEKESR